ARISRPPFHSSKRGVKPRLRAGSAASCHGGMASVKAGREHFQGIVAERNLARRPSNRARLDWPDPMDGRSELVSVIPKRGRLDEVTENLEDDSKDSEGDHERVWALVMRYLDPECIAE